MIRLQIVPILSSLPLKIFHPIIELLFPSLLPVSREGGRGEGRKDGMVHEYHRSIREGMDEVSPPRSPSKAFRVKYALPGKS
jgi:hypothetical protein